MSQLEQLKQYTTIVADTGLYNDVEFIMKLAPDPQVEVRDGRFVTASAMDLHGKLLVERLSAEEGADVALEPILYRSEEAVFDAKGLAKVKVTAKVIAHERGEKLRVFKFKPKRGYKRRTGHRQELTRIEVTEIKHGS